MALVDGAVGAEKVKVVLAVHVPHVAALALVEHDCGSEARCAARRGVSRDGA